MKHFTCFLLLAPVLLPLSGCDFRQEAIGLSNWTLDFSRSEIPTTMHVWNLNDMIVELTVAIKADQPWILVSEEEIISGKPGDSVEGPFDKRAVIVSIDRTQLDKGEHTGTITFTSKGIKPKEVAVRALMDQDGRLATLNLVNTTVNYSKPYVIDFSFGLKDAKGQSVVGEPSQFTLGALEGDVRVGEENGLQLRRAAARQLKLGLVLDYSAAMQDQFGAVQTMEDTAKNILLPALNTEALVAVTEFHRDDQEAAAVADFTVDRPFIRGRIDAIQTEYVRGWYSGARLFDALVMAARQFSSGEPLQEARHIIVFTDGKDTSSLHGVDEAVYNATQRNVHISVVGFGQDTSLATLLDLTGRTGGAYYPAASADELPSAIQQVIDNLAGQYVIRWASLRRKDEPFKPSFTLRMGDTRVSYTAKDNFDPGALGGDVLQGNLRLVASNAADSGAVVLRADYMPRFIRKIRIYAYSALDFSAVLVSPADDGILSGWTLEVTEDTDTGGFWIHAQSPGPPAPFASFGPVFRFEFGEPPAPDQPLFDELYVDNSLYLEGEKLVISGFEPND